MKVNWNSVYRTISYNLTKKQKDDLSFTLSCLEQGIIILEKLDKLSDKNYSEDDIAETLRSFIKDEDVNITDLSRDIKQIMVGGESND